MPNPPDPPPFPYASLAAGNPSGLGEPDEAARVHHALRRHGGRLAAHRACPVIGKTADYRIHRPGRASSQSPWSAAFARRLHELGWIERSSIEIEYRWADGTAERLSEFAADLVRLKVNVIITGGTPATIAAKRATAVIPIVFVGVSDPIGSELVASLARPGGNVTGLSIQNVDTASKRVEFLHDVVPNLRRLAVLANESNPVMKREVEAVQAAAHALGVEVAPLEVRRADDIAPAFAALDGRADALYVTADPLLSNNTITISALTLNARLPNMHSIREEVVSGGLLSYGASFPDMFRRAAELVDKILRGGNLPTFRLSSRPSSISWSTSRPLRRSV